MTIPLVSLLVLLIVVCLALWVIRTLSGSGMLPAPFGTILYVVVVFVAVLALLQMLGVWGGAGHIRISALTWQTR